MEQMQNFVGTNALLWQKIAVNVQSSTTLEELLDGLKRGATFFHIRCGLYTAQQYTTLLDRCNEAINTYAELCEPWKVATGIICELSGPQPRIHFTTDKAEVRVTEHQLLTLTGDARYENQCFDEIKYVSNFEQLKCSSVGNVLSIGSVKLTVERIVSDVLTCKVMEGGLLKAFSILTRATNDDSIENDVELDLSSSLAELDRFVKTRCRFVIVPQMNVKTLRKLFKSFKSIAPEREIQFILSVDDFPSLKHLNELEQSFHAYSTKDIDALKHIKATGKPVLFVLEVAETPELIEDADVIIVDCSELTRLQDYLKLVNRIQIEKHQQPIRNISPDDSALPHCLDFSAKEAKASAIVLPTVKANPTLATEICLMNPFCIVLISTCSAQEADRLLLRKYAVPIVEPAVSTIPQQRLIRRAIAYGRRFGYLHGGNCIVSGVELESETDVVGMEIRYVPQVPAARQQESAV